MADIEADISEALQNDLIRFIPQSQGLPIKTFRGMAVLIDDNLTTADIKARRRRRPFDTANQAGNPLFQQGLAQNIRRLSSSCFYVSEIKHLCRAFSIPPIYSVS
ncbi:MAG: hypothetical protein ACLQMO_11335 [Acidobacteriaceae bacterium]